MVSCWFLCFLREIAKILKKSENTIVQKAYDISRQKNEWESNQSHKQASKQAPLVRSTYGTYCKRGITEASPVCETKRIAGTKEHQENQYHTEVRSIASRALAYLSHLLWHPIELPCLHRYKQSYYFILKRIGAAVFIFPFVYSSKKRLDTNKN